MLIDAQMQAIKANHNLIFLNYKNTKDITDVIGRVTTVDPVKRKNSVLVNDVQPWPFIWRWLRNKFTPATCKTISMISVSLNFFDFVTTPEIQAFSFLIRSLIVFEIALNWVKWVDSFVGHDDHLLFISSITHRANTASHGQFDRWQPGTITIIILDIHSKLTFNPKYVYP